MVIKKCMKNFGSIIKLKNGKVFNGYSFAADTRRVSGEFVFTTSPVGYTESMTDPSYKSQILVFTQPLIGNYGVPKNTLDNVCLPKYFESKKIHVNGIVMADYSEHYSHWNAAQSLKDWCISNDIVGVTGVDTRALVTELRLHGSTTGEILRESQTEALESRVCESSQLTPETTNLVSLVSTKEPCVYNAGGSVRIVVIDMGVKYSIIRYLVGLGAQVTVVPWDCDVDTLCSYDGILISNGPGDPRMCTETISNINTIITQKLAIPIFGVCMGNQILGLAAGYNLYKLPFGNRGHNQPVIATKTGRCFITAQNHGYALDDTLENRRNGCDDDWYTLYRNANDNTNEGIAHRTLPYSAVQFHPEAHGGPLDTEFLLRDFVKIVRALRSK